MDGVNETKRNVDCICVLLHIILLFLPCILPLTNGWAFALAEGGSTQP